jgi:hypothetical protein
MQRVICTNSFNVKSSCSCVNFELLIETTRVSQCDEQQTTELTQKAN